MKWRATSLAIIAAFGMAACDSATADEQEQEKTRLRQGSGPSTSSGPSRASSRDGEAGSPRPRLKSKKVPPEERLDALARASVWQQPRVPVNQARLGNDPQHPQSLECKFAITELGGTSPKFDCDLPNGERIRVKYGRSPEVGSEVASSRLLQGLGFGADNMTLVEKLRCYGCPAEPYLTMRTLGLAGAEDLYGKVANKDSFKEFDWVAIERKHYGRGIETEELEGWAFFELDLIDPKKGGSPRAHVDALRLMAVFLAHWDNKSENQRLVCLSEKDWPEGGRCSRPMALLQDLGSSFGPRKVDLPRWQQAALWGDRATCTATMDALPYNGATFKPVKITEAGRLHLASLLKQLSDAQLTALFRDARFDHATGFMGKTPASVPDWVRAFKAKVRQISDGPPCPQ